MAVATPLLPEQQLLYRGNGKESVDMVFACMEAEESSALPQYENLSAAISLDTLSPGDMKYAINKTDSESIVCKL